jgi:hypothetical protein
MAGRKSGVLRGLPAPEKGADATGLFAGHYNLGQQLKKWCLTLEVLSDA